MNTLLTGLAAVRTSLGSQAQLVSYYAVSQQKVSCQLTWLPGDALVTTDQAALYTDGRYFLQAGMEMDENWTLMKMGLPDTPSQSDWLVQVIRIISILLARLRLIDCFRFYHHVQLLLLTRHCSHTRNGGNLKKCCPRYEQLVDAVRLYQDTSKLNPRCLGY